MITKLTFEEAFGKLTSLVAEIEDDDIKLDTLAEKVDTANDLILYCEAKLRNIKDETEKRRSIQ